MYSKQQILPDLPTGKASCENCTRKGIMCYRTKQLKNIHNGIIYNNGEPTGIISLCLHYTGIYTINGKQLFDL